MLQRREENGEGQSGRASATPGTRDPDRFINRELSWLAFNERVLEEAINETHPLLERLRFLSISDSNLGEFFAVRVAGLKGQVRAGVTTRSADGLTPSQQLDAIRWRAADVMEDQQTCWRKLRAELAEDGIQIVDAGDLTETEQGWLDRHFMEQIFSVLTPVAIDPAHPFPFIANFGFSIALRLERPDGEEALAGLISIPHGLPRFVQLPEGRSGLSRSSRSYRCFSTACSRASGSKTTGSSRSFAIAISRSKKRLKTLCDCSKRRFANVAGGPSFG